MNSAVVANVINIGGKTMNQNNRALPSLASAFKALHFATLVLIAGGCASSSRKSVQPKPGSGIAEYRALTREAHDAMTATMNSLDALARAENLASALPDFDRT